MPSSISASGPEDSKWERPFIFAGFLLTGVIAVILGPLIPELEAVWGIDHAQSGSLFLVQFASSSIAAIISNFNLRRSLIVGYALAMVSLFVLVWGGWPLALVAMAISGFSLGLVISGSNLLVAEKNPTRRGAALSTLNLIWGLGAVASPLLFAAFVETIGAFVLLQILGLAAGLVSLTLAFVVRNPTRTAAGARPAGSESISTTAGEAETPPIAPSPVALLVLVGALFFFYVGTEISVGGWMVSLAKQFSTEQGVVSLVIGSGFWAAVLVGRAVAALVLRRLDERSVYATSLAIAGLGLGCLYLADSQSTVAAGAVLAGLGLAALFPLTVSILTTATAANRAYVPGLLLACGGLGGSLLPWLTGRLSKASGSGPDAIEASLSRGFLVPIVGLIALSSLYVLYRRAMRKPRALAPDGEPSP